VTTRLEGGVAVGEDKHALGDACARGMVVEHLACHVMPLEKLYRVQGFGV